MTYPDALLLAAAYLWGFYGLFVIIMGLYRVYLAKKMTPFLWVMGGPFVLVGGAVDVLSQYTLACLVFGGLPRWREYTVSQRMMRLRIEEPDSWRGRLATYICDKGLDPLDPSGNHC